MLSFFVALGTCFDLGKLFLDWYERNYVANSLSEADKNEGTSINADEKLLLIKSYREKSGT